MSGLHAGDEIVGGRLESSELVGRDSTKRGQNFDTSGLRVGIQAIMMAKLISTLALGGDVDGRQSRIPYQYCEVNEVEAEKRRDIDAI